MPTLIRLIITLLFLAGLVYAGMFALVAFVEPTPKEVTIRIPQRDLLSGGQPALPGQQNTTAPAAEPEAPENAPAAQ
jgi:hypothetical protein